MFCDVARKTFNILMEERLLQDSRRTVNHNVLMYFNVAHRIVLISEATLKMTLAAPKQGELPKPGIAKPKHSSEKIHLEEQIVALEPRILNCIPHFIRQFRRQDLISIQQQDPFILERQ